MLDTAATSPSFLECRTPSRSPVAPKSLLAPYATWTKLRSMQLLRSSSRTDVNGTGSAARGLS